MNVNPQMLASEVLPDRFMKKEVTGSDIFGGMKELTESDNVICEFINNIGIWIKQTCFLLFHLKKIV
jgi:hypothetical protein